MIGTTCRIQGLESKQVIAVISPRLKEVAATMLRGHVDMVSRQLISGWAASTSDPNEVLGVSIFVDDQKIGQVDCALPRADLQQLGTFGHGMHGFRFEFAEPLGRDSDKRVTVRLSATGRPLAEGDILLRANDSTEVLARPVHRFISDPGPIDAPRDLRGLIEAFALLDDQAGGYDLLSRFDLEQITPRQAHYMVFGSTNSPPTARDVADRYSARDDINDLLHSEAFQTNLIPLILKAFAEKQRIIFVHVPKCAGTRPLGPSHAAAAGLAPIDDRSSLDEEERPASSPVQVGAELAVFRPYLHRRP